MSRAAASRQADIVEIVALLVGRRPELDGLRAALLFEVMLWHAGWHRLTGAGATVWVFFTLSGFLITWLLLDEHRLNGVISLRAFYGRRAARLLPAIVLTLAAVAAYSWLIDTNVLQARQNLRALPWSLFYGANWRIIAGQPFAMLSHTWSLSVEEQFYAIWPLFLVLALRFRRTTLPLFAAIGALVAYSFLSRVFWLHPFRPGGDGRLIGTDMIGDQCMFGCALAAVLYQHPQTIPALRRITRVLAWPATAWVLICFASTTLTVRLVKGLPFPLSVNGALGTTAFGLASTLLICHLVLQPKDVFGRILALRPLPWCGRVSYGLYLYHLPIFVGLTESGWFHRRATLWPTEFALTFAVAAFSFYFIELPIQRRWKMPLEKTPTERAAHAQVDPALTSASDDRAQVESMGSSAEVRR